jgi:hypothetical protein
MEFAGRRGCIKATYPTIFSGNALKPPQLVAKGQGDALR